MSSPPTTPWKNPLNRSYSAAPNPSHSIASSRTNSLDAIEVVKDKQGRRTHKTIRVAQGEVDGFVDTVSRQTSHSKSHEPDLESPYLHPWELDSEEARRKKKLSKKVHGAEGPSMKSTNKSVIGRFMDLLTPKSSRTKSIDPKKRSSVRVPQLITNKSVPRVSGGQQKHPQQKEVRKSLGKISRGPVAPVDILEPPKALLPEPSPPVTLPEPPRMSWFGSSPAPVAPVIAPEPPWASWFGSSPATVVPVIPPVSPTSWFGSSKPIADPVIPPPAPVTLPEPPRTSWFGSSEAPEPTPPPAAVPGPPTDPPLTPEERRRHTFTADAPEDTEPSGFPSISPWTVLYGITGTVAVVSAALLYAAYAPVTPAAPVFVGSNYCSRFGPTV